MTKVVMKLVEGAVKVGVVTEDKVLYTEEAYFVGEEVEFEEKLGSVLAKTYTEEKVEVLEAYVFCGVETELVIEKYYYKVKEGVVETYKMYEEDETGYFEYPVKYDEETCYYTVYGTLEKEVV